MYGWTHKKPFTGGRAGYFIHNDGHMIPRNDVLIVLFDASIEHHAAPIGTCSWRACKGSSPFSPFIRTYLGHTILVQHRHLKFLAPNLNVFLGAIHTLVFHSNTSASQPLCCESRIVIPIFQNFEIDLNRKLIFKKMKIH